MGKVDRVFIGPLATVCFHIPLLEVGIWPVSECLPKGISQIKQPRGHRSREQSLAAKCPASPRGKYQNLIFSCESAAF